MVLSESQSEEKQHLKSDVRIEPVGVGLRQWEEDDRIPLIDIVRREGQIIYLEGTL
ncbi:MAG: hypothetical protein HQL93_00215 [Magnetococcales bacterium]|nr:hypothetical protein [Magnetococcales bacterium]